MGRQGSRKGWTRIFGRDAPAGTQAGAGFAGLTAWGGDGLTRPSPADGDATGYGAGETHLARADACAADVGCAIGGDRDSLFDRVRDAVAGLPLFEREVYLMAARDGLDDRRIALRLAIDAAEVRRLLAAALVRISAALDDGDDA